MASAVEGSDVHPRLAGRLQLEKLVGHVEVVVLVLHKQMPSPVRRPHDDDGLAGSENDVPACVLCSDMETRD